MTTTLPDPETLLPEKVESPFVSPERRVVDPNLVRQSFVDRLPQPVGWRVLVMPFEGRKTTKGGVIVPDSVRERESLASVVALVLRVGPLAYKDPEKFGPDPTPWCKEGQWVCIGRYTGSRFRLEDGEVRIVNDDEVIAVISDPEDILNA